MPSANEARLDVRALFVGLGLAAACFPAGLAYWKRVNWPARGGALTAALVVVTAVAGVAGQGAVGPAWGSRWLFGLVLANALTVSFVLARAARPRPGWPAWLHQVVFFAWPPLAALALLAWLATLRAGGWDARATLLVATAAAWLALLVGAAIGLPPPDWRLRSR